MHEALHSTSFQHITVADYHRAFGRPPVGDTSPDTRPRAICPFCRQKMTIVGDKSSNTIGHFAHQRGSGFCPAKEKAGAPYLRLTPKRADPEKGMAIRREFKTTWQHQLSHLESLVPALHVYEFLSLLELADKWRIWEYSGMTAGDVPYVLLVLADFSTFTAQKNQDGTSKRRFYLRFFYDAALKDIEDLWIWPGEKPTLHRVSYAPMVRGGLPTEKNINKSTSVDAHNDFLIELTPIPAKPAWLVRVVETWFTQNWVDLD